MTQPKPPVDLDISVQWVTPEVAEDWLKYNTHNRRVSDRLVRVYVDTIKNGEWKLNGEPIIFDTEGTLQSGQHRLLAILQAQMPIWTVVVEGAEPESVYTIDAGRKRRMADVLYLRGETDVNILASALSWLWRWQVGAMDMLGETATNAHLLKLYDETPTIRDSLYWGRKMRPALGFGPGLMAALHWGFSQIDEDDAEMFFTKLFEGANLPNGDPILALLRQAQRMKREAHRPSQVVIAAIVVKAWNAYREHRTVKGSYSFRANEEFPEAV